MIRVTLEFIIQAELLWGEEGSTPGNQYQSHRCEQGLVWGVWGCR
jgi:hypothetical protein